MTVRKLTALRFIHLLVLGLALNSAGRAQGSWGTLTGVVQDPSGAVMPGVAVHAKNVGTSSVVP